MYPEDRVLVGVMPDPGDLSIAREQHWYRIPMKHAPQGIHAEYIAFYLTQSFGPELRWAIHYYARRTGHELVRRIDLFPDQPDHPRARDMYYKLQLGPLREKHPPVVSTQWRRITFIQTTWDRFVSAAEMKDLLSADNAFVKRIYRRLREHRIRAERGVLLTQGKVVQSVDLVVRCKDGPVMISASPDPSSEVLSLRGDESADLVSIERAIEKRGGALMLDSPL